MDREKALILVQAIITRYKDIPDEAGTEIAMIIDNALMQKSEEQ